MGEERGIPYLAEQLLKGETLDERLIRTGPPPICDVLRIGREIAEGLSAAHARGLIHRDIKPSNVFLVRNAECGVRNDDESPIADSTASLRTPHSAFRTVKVLDFGLVRPAEDDAHLTQTGILAGTPQYMAPEQASGKAVDHRCDLFSLGCVLYRMTTGRLPFSGPNTLAVLRALAVEQPPAAHEINPAVPGSLSTLIARLLEKEPARRPQTAQDVAAALARIEKNVLDDAAAQKRRTRRRIALAAAVALLAVSLGVVAAFGPATVYRFATNQGQLVIETVDPQVEITVKGGGEQFKITDVQTGREVTLKAGKYELELAAKDGLTLSTKEFTLDRGGQQIVKVRYEPALAKQPLTSDVAVVESEPPGEVACFRDLPNYPQCMAFSPDGKQAWVGLGHAWQDGNVVSNAKDKWLLGYDVPSRSERFRHTEHKNVILGIAPSEDSRHVYSCAWGRHILQWDATSGKLLGSFQGPYARGWSVALAPNAVGPCSAPRTASPSSGTSSESARSPRSRATRKW